MGEQREAIISVLVEFVFVVLFFLTNPATGSEEGRKHRTKLERLGL